MNAKIRGDIADAQSSIRIATVGTRSDELPERFGMPPVPAAQFLVNHVSIADGMNLETVDQVAVCIRIVRLEPEGLSIRGNCLIQLPGAEQDIPEIVVRFYEIGFQLNGFSIGGCGLVELP